MKKKVIHGILSAIILLICLGACMFQTTESTSNGSDGPEDTATGEVISAIASPYCPVEASYGQIDEVAPLFFNIVSTSPTFTWYYTNGNLNFKDLDM